VCQAVARGILRNVGCDITAKYSFALSLSFSLSPPSFLPPVTSLLRPAARACTVHRVYTHRATREGVLKTARVWSDITRTPSRSRASQSLTVNIDRRAAASCRNRRADCSPTPIDAASGIREWKRRCGTRATRASHVARRWRNGVPVSSSDRKHAGGPIA